MEKSIHNKKVGVRTLVCVLVLAVLFFILILRVPYGYDWTDEQYYTEIAYRLLQGDRPLVDTWEVHQFSAMLSAPVLQAYLLFNGGSTDGAILFMRYFYVTFQFAVGLIAFFLLQKRSGSVPALLAAAMIMAFSHFSINSYFYNSMTLLFMLLSALFYKRFADETERPGRGAALLSGVTFALAVLAYPYAAACLAVYLSFWLVRVCRRGSKRRSIAGALWFFAGGALVALTVAAYVCSRSSVAQALQGIWNIMSDPDHQTVRFGELLKRYFNTIRVVFSPVSYGAAALLLLGILYRTLPENRARRVVKTLGTALTLLLLFGSVVVALVYSWNGIYRINLLAAAFALSAPGLFFFTKRHGDEGTLLLYFLGAALSVAVQVGSNTRFSASSGMLLPASVATLLYVFDHKDELLTKPLPEAADPQKFARRSNRLFLLLAAAGVFCVASLTVLRVTAMHRDDPIGMLDATIESGAAAGIKTTKESAELHDRLVADIRANAPEDGTILISYLFPEGYLLTGLKAATPSTFNMPLDSQWLAEYYEQHPEREPSYIFCIDPETTYNGASMAGFEQYAENPAYRVEQTQTGTALIRIGGNE